MLKMHAFEKALKNNDEIKTFLTVFLVIILLVEKKINYSKVLHHGYFSNQKIRNWHVLA